MHSIERRLPDGVLSLVINLHENQTNIYDPQHPEQWRRYHGTLLNGAHSVYTLLDASALTSVIGVDFHPGGALPFLRVPANELHNQTVPLEEVWDDGARSLREQILEAGTPPRQFALLERFLLSCLNESHTTHPVVSFAISQMRTMLLETVPPISTITEQIGMSHTHFIHVFRDAVGMTPKQFYRLLRFQEVLRQLERGSLKSMAQLAIDGGYFDQAHLSHDFRAFAGMTPKAYLTARSEYRNHVLLVD